MDVFVANAGEGLVAVGEIKASDWDRMTPGAVRRNVLRQARQVWEYIESQLGDSQEVSPGMIFPRRPTLCVVCSSSRPSSKNAEFQWSGRTNRSLTGAPGRNGVRHRHDDLSDSTLERSRFARG
jgi:sulfite reductase alpha subunit-like flavoprotein